jgi:peptidoglycan/LPS O-acetylase OafA/YrhL
VSAAGEAAATADDAPRRRLRSADRDSIAVRLRERLYVTFVSLAVVLTMSAHASDVDPGGAATSLVVTALGTVLAAFAAELLSHLITHESLPGRSEALRTVRACLGALGAIVVPLLVLGAGALADWDVATLLHVCAAVLVATLGGAGWVGVRRTSMPTGQKIVALVGLVLLGAAVVGLKLLAGH